jgi:alpha-beta hydrolase superfamily lysophospholipase
MGNYMKGVDDQKLMDAEKALFNLSGLDYSTIKITNVVIDTEGNYVRTFDIPPISETAPTVVIIHGYGAFAAIFYKVLKSLVDAGLHLVLIDIIGMGTSSRPEFDKDQTPD